MWSFSKKFINIISLIAIILGIVEVVFIIYIFLTGGDDWTFINAFFDFSMPFLLIVSAILSLKNQISSNAYFVVAIIAHFFSLIFLPFAILNIMFGFIWAITFFGFYASFMAGVVYLLVDFLIQKFKINKMDVCNKNGEQ